MATLDETRDMLLSGACDGGPCSPLTFEPRDLKPILDRLPLLALLLGELSPERSMAFLIDARRLPGLSTGADGRAVEHLAHCVADILARDLTRGLRRLGGRGLAPLSGRGLAPRSGGGFVAGLLAALNIVERASGRSLASARRRVFEEARTHDVAGDALIYAASEGYVSEATDAVVRAMARGSTSDVRRLVARSIAVGDRRGADSLVGLYMTLRSKLPERLARASDVRVT